MAEKDKKKEELENEEINEEVVEETTELIEEPITEEAKEETEEELPLEMEKLHIHEGMDRNVELMRFLSDDEKLNELEIKEIASVLIKEKEGETEEEIEKARTLLETTLNFILVDENMSEEEKTIKTAYELLLKNSYSKLMEKMKEISDDELLAALVLKTEDLIKRNEKSQIIGLTIAKLAEGNINLSPAEEAGLEEVTEQEVDSSENKEEEKPQERQVPRGAVSKRFELTPSEKRAFTYYTEELSKASKRRQERLEAMVLEGTVPRYEQEIIASRQSGQIIRGTIRGISRIEGVLHPYVQVGNVTVRIPKSEFTDIFLTRGFVWKQIVGSVVDFVIVDYLTDVDEYDPQGRLYIKEAIGSRLIANSATFNRALSVLKVDQTYNAEIVFVVKDFMMINLRGRDMIINNFQIQGRMIDLRTKYEAGESIKVRIVSLDVPSGEIAIVPVDREADTYFMFVEKYSPGDALLGKVVRQNNSGIYVEIPVDKHLTQLVRCQHQLWTSSIEEGDMLTITYTSSNDNRKQVFGRIDNLTKKLKTIY